MSLITVPHDIVEKVCELKSFDNDEDYTDEIHRIIEHFHFHCNPCNEDLDADEVSFSEDGIICPSCGTAVEMYV